MDYQFESLIDSSVAVKLLGIHPKTLQNMARHGRIPGIWIGKYWRFRVPEIGRWIQAEVNYPGYAHRQHEEVKP